MIEDAEKMLERWVLPEEVCATVQRLIDMFREADETIQKLHDHRSFPEEQAQIYESYMFVHDPEHDEIGGEGA